MSERIRLTVDDLPRPSDFGNFHPFLRGVFSQWHSTGFEIDGQAFSCAEQWMMYAKAHLFGDEMRAAAILATDDPGEQKRHGQLVEGFESAVWDAWKIDIVLRGNLAKFSQNPGAARQLKATAGALLVEANPRDWIWGCGLTADDPRVHDPREWRGENLLGRVLTFVRDARAG
jgi:ribA/ribD-fused uncharacterized protein